MNKLKCLQLLIAEYFTINTSPCLIPALKFTEFIFCVEYHISSVTACYIELLGDSYWDYVQVYWLSISVCKKVAVLHSQTVFHML